MYVYIESFCYNWNHVPYNYNCQNKISILQEIRFDPVKKINKNFFKHGISYQEKT